MGIGAFHRMIRGLTGKSTNHVFQPKEALKEAGELADSAKPKDTIVGTSSESNAAGAEPPPDPSLTYEARLNAQIEQYRQAKNIHELPEIFHYWSNKFLRPRLNEVMGVDSITDFYAGHFAQACERTASCQRSFLSMGSGDSSVEIEVVKRLLALGLQTFNFTCLEVSPPLVDRAVGAIRNEGLESLIQIECMDINHWSPKLKYAGIMANHSLHHFVELEKIFDNIKLSLKPGGFFVTNDMIGRNGHMRWPEALEVIEGLWAFLPDRFKYNWQLSRLEKQFINWDCSNEGFEAVRSQDILPLLVPRFAFKSFLAFGGIIDVFTDRAFGHNYDPTQESHRAFIDFVNYMNDVLIDSGTLKPTTVFAVLSADPTAETRQWRHWSPLFSMRKPELIG